MDVFSDTDQFVITATQPLALEAVSLTYPGASNPAVENVSLSLNPAETLGILGPSGCGKSTLLRLAAGLERPDRGRVRIADRDVTQDPPERRGVGLVFQDYALWPHRTVAGNVRYGLEEQRLSRAEITRRTDAALERVNLGGYGTRRIEALSGGERQRVALARALAPEPRVLLMDEPLSNLDERLRNELRLELRGLFHALGLSVVFVTHDQREAFALSHRIAVMRSGQIVQTGTPQEVFNAPTDAWTARFLGHKNLLEPAAAVSLGLACAPGQCLLVPERAIAVLDGIHGNTVPDGVLMGHVLSTIFEGRSSQITILVQGVTLEFDHPTPIEPGTRVQIRLEQNAIQAVRA
jgi:ABC-type Fe3+/spermidine/putrescine transport system ATPase subunit